VSRRAKALLGVGALLALGIAGTAWFLSRDTAPPPVELADCTLDTDVDVATASAEGRWEAVPGEETFVGYRIEEAFGGDTFLREIGGRTPAVEATLELAGATVAAAEVHADLRELASDQARRDRFLEQNGLETEAFPEASFVLAEPIDLPATPVAGKLFDVDAVGDLELHGVTKQVTVPVEGCWTGSRIDVVGSLPILLADFDIVPPDVPGLARAEPDGVLELKLHFARGDSDLTD
jgi:polyisoprenoid-binding protein YceI